jgi:alcohol dehydrogenase class IV
MRRWLNCCYLTSNNTPLFCQPHLKKVSHLKVEISLELMLKSAAKCGESEMNENYKSKTHVFFSPTKITIGLNSALQAGHETKQFGCAKVLIVTDPGVVQTNLIKPVESAFSSEDIGYVVYDGVEPEPPSRVIDRGAEIFKSDILAAKAITLIAENLPTAWAKGPNTQARCNMSLAAALAGMAFGSGGLGAVHALAYPLGTEY